MEKGVHRANQAYDGQFFQAGWLSSVSCVPIAALQQSRLTYHRQACLSFILISHSTVVLILILVTAALVSFFIVLHLKKRGNFKSQHAIM